MGNISIDIPPPLYWQDFELLTLDKCKHLWDDDYAQPNGRQGQKQHGVDIFGDNRKTKEHIGVQCKQRKRNNTLLTSSTLTTTEIDKEIAKATKFTPPLNRFIIATTGSRDSKLQTYVKTLNQNDPPFQTTLWFWEDYIHFLNSNDTLMYKYYENILKYRGRYSHDEHYLRLLAHGFDRPAMRTTFHLENRVDHFLDAITCLQQLVATGRLTDRDSRLIDQANLPIPLPAPLKTIKTLLTQISETVTSALVNNQIIQHQTVIQILDPTLQTQINHIRTKIINILNELLNEASIPTIQMRAP